MIYQQSDVLKNIARNALSKDVYGMVWNNIFEQKKSRMYIYIYINIDGEPINENSKTSFVICKEIGKNDRVITAPRYIFTLWKILSKKGKSDKTTVWCAQENC